MSRQPGQHGMRWAVATRVSSNGGDESASMNRMRIMHVVHTLGTGGTEAGVRKLLAGLDPCRFEQYVCAVTAGPATDPQTGARIFSLGRQRPSKGSLLLDFYRVFSRHQPDVIHARNWGTIEAIPAARLARVRSVIYSEHGLDVRTVSAQPWRRNAFRRLCFPWTDQVFAVSEGLRDYFVRQLHIRPERFPVIANGVDTDHFRPLPHSREELRRELGFGPDVFVVGTVSRLDPVKDHRTLFRAAERLLAKGCPLQLIVVGDGPERAALEREVSSSRWLATRVQFTGERNDVLRWLQSFDVFVLPSLAEGMSNTLLEAMASEVVPVASRVGGNPEVIEEERSGLLFNAGDVGALAACLEKLAHDSGVRKTLAAGARQRVQSCFSLDRMLDNYARLYEGVAASRETRQRVRISESSGHQKHGAREVLETARKSH